MFGAGEPRLRALPAVQAARVAELRAAVDPVRLRSALEALPAPRVRHEAPAAMATLDEALRQEFAAAGWQAELDAFSPRGGPPGVNVVARKPGARAEAVVVVAHRDTVPRSGGADDNGSGMVALLELARLLGPQRADRTVVLAAVDHEELGFLGSTRLVERLRAEAPVLGAYVFEMVAYTSAQRGSQQLPAGIGAVYHGQVAKVRARQYRGDFTAVLYRRSAERLARLFAEALAHLAGPQAPILLRAPADLPLLGPLLERTVPFVRDFARSDHVPFWAAGLPAVQITDTADFRNPHYHLPGDLPATLDYGRLADVTAAAALAVQALAGRG